MDNVKVYVEHPLTKQCIDCSLNLANTTMTLCETNWSNSVYLRFDVSLSLVVSLIWLGTGQTYNLNMEVSTVLKTHGNFKYPKKNNSSTIAMTKSNKVIVRDRALQFASSGGCMIPCLLRHSSPLKIKTSIGSMNKKLMLANVPQAPENPTFSA
jgi:hypothetical protein